jgi:hypothetical protein
MGSEENRTRVSLASHSPWKSLARFPHFHRPDDDLTFTNHKPKGAQRRIASLPPSGSFFNEKMLSNGTPTAQCRAVSPSSDFLTYVHMDESRQTVEVPEADRER